MESSGAESPLTIKPMAPSGWTGRHDCSDSELTADKRQRIQRRLFDRHARRQAGMTR
jgi:hypothetical protein